MDVLCPWIWLVIAALAAGAVNSLAGGGTLLTFPTLLAALAPLGPEAAVVANMTSTVALVPGSLAGAWGYRRELAAVRPWLLWLAGPSLVGGLIGAILVTRLDPVYFAFLVPWLTLLAALIFLAQPLVAPKRDISEHLQSHRHRLAAVLFQLLVAIYGGYFGAGIGILMLGAFAVLGLSDVHQMNALKTLLAVLINGISVVVFIVDGQIVWRYALVMAVSAMVGGYLAARCARYLPRWFVRWTVIAAGLGISAYLFWQRATAS